MSDSTGDWVRPRPDARGFRRDIALAVVVLLLTTLSVLLHGIAGYYADPAPIWVSAICVVAMCAPLLARRRYPAVTAIVVSAIVIVFVSLRVPDLLMYNITLFIAIYTLGAWGRDRVRANVVRSIIVVGMFIWLFIVLVGQLENPPSIPGVPDGVVSPALVALAGVQILTNLLYFAGSWYFGDRAWAAAKERAVLQDRTVELAREREVSAAQAISLERVRIARELHDVVAHHVSVMGIQAGAARRVLSTDPAKATESLASIESSARNAVDELHRLLTTLRSDETDDTPAVTGIEQIAELVSDVRDANLHVRYSIFGDIRPLPATTSVTAYRVTREALTNAVKHGGSAASVDLRVRYLADAVEVEVADDGVGTRHRSAGGGLGLIGMRERVIAVGGELRAGPRSRGGFLVRATLPTTTDRTTTGMTATETASHTEAGSPANADVPADLPSSDAAARA